MPCRATAAETDCCVARRGSKLPAGDARTHLGEPPTRALTRQACENMCFSLSGVSAPQMSAPGRGTALGVRLVTAPKSAQDAEERGERTLTIHQVTGNCSGGHAVQAIPPRMGAACSLHLRNLETKRSKSRVSATHKNSQLALGRPGSACVCAACLHRPETRPPSASNATRSALLFPNHARTVSQAAREGHIGDVEDMHWQCHRRGRRKMLPRDIDAAGKQVAGDRWQRCLTGSRQSLSKVLATPMSRPGHPNGLMSRNTTNRI